MFSLYSIEENRKVESLLCLIADYSAIILRATDAICDIHSHAEFSLSPKSEEREFAKKKFHIVGHVIFAQYIRMHVVYNNIL